MHRAYSRSRERLVTAYGVTRRTVVGGRGFGLKPREHARLPPALHGKKSCPHLIQNNTSFPVQITAKLTQLYADVQKLRGGDSEESRWAASLKYYQYIVKEYMTNPEYGVGLDGNARGLLVYHTMGMGKTILAVGVALAAMEGVKGSTRTPIVVLPHSLQKNFKGAIEWVLRRLHPDIAADSAAFDKLVADTSAKFQFISMDAYNMADQVSRVGAVAKKKGPPRGENAVLDKEIDQSLFQLGVGSGSTLDGKILIVDEAHGLFRAIINSGSEHTNARRFYEMVMGAKDLRIVFLTGTPASKNPFEIVPCFNMLAGRDLLPPVYDTFERLYVDKDRGVMKNRNKLANRLMGMVSFVTPTLPTIPLGVETEEKAKQPRDDGGFPERLPLIISRPEMAPDQYRQYLLAREKEEAEKQGRGTGGPRAESLASPALMLPGSEKKAMSTYYVRSRGLSNFAPPREYADKPVAAMPNSVFTAATSPKMALIADRVSVCPGPALIYSQFVGVGGLAVMARFLQNKGYKPLPTASEMKNSEIETKHGGAETKSPAVAVPPTADSKLVAADSKPVTADSKPVTADSKPVTADSKPVTADSKPVTADSKATDSKSVAIESKATDSKPIAIESKATDSKPIKQTSSAPLLTKTRRYAIISGGTSSEERARIVGIFNLPKNKHGELIQVLLVSKTGAEGLDLKCIREIHQLEPYWDMARHDQVDFRGVRLGSHDMLPRSEREVQSYLYVSAPNAAMLADMPLKNREPETIDGVFYDRAVKNYRLNSDCREVLKSCCIEGAAFGYEGCRRCVPTGVPLYQSDAAADVRLPDPCQQTESGTVQAHKITLRLAPGEKSTDFYYTINPEELYGYRFYEHRADLGGYAPLEPSDLRIAALADAIKARNATV